MYLYAVYLGGELAPGRMGEDHEVVFVVGGDDIKDVRTRAKAKWGGSSRPHVDAVKRIERIDGHAVSLTETGGDDLAELDTSYNA